MIFQSNWPVAEGPGADHIKTSRATDKRIEILQRADYFLPFYRRSFTYGGETAVASHGSSAFVSCISSLAFNLLNASCIFRVFCKLWINNHSIDLSNETCVGNLNCKEPNRKRHLCSKIASRIGCSISANTTAISRRTQKRPRR